MKLLRKIGMLFVLSILAACLGVTGCGNSSEGNSAANKTEAPASSSNTATSDSVSSDALETQQSVDNNVVESQGITIEDISFSLDEKNICTAKATLTNHDPIPYNVVEITDLLVKAERIDNYGDPVEEEFALFRHGLNSFYVLDGVLSEDTVKQYVFNAISPEYQPYIYDIKEKETREITIVLMPDYMFTDSGLASDVTQAIPTTAIERIACEPCYDEVLSPSLYNISSSINADSTIAASIENLSDSKWRNVTLYYVPLDASGDIVFDDSATEGIRFADERWMSASYIKPGDSSELDTQYSAPSGAAQIAVIKAEYRPDNS